MLADLSTRPDYRWFGGGPHEPIPNLGSKLAKHTKGDSKGVKKERPLHRVVVLGTFTKVVSMTDVADLLFRASADARQRVI